MTGRAASRILNGPQGQAVVSALRAVVAETVARAEAQGTTCEACGGKLEFEPDRMRGTLREVCGDCRTVRAVPRSFVTPAAPVEPTPRRVRPTSPAPAPRYCQRCEAPLPERRGPGRRPRFCRNRRACEQAVAVREGRTPVKSDGPASVRMLLLEAMPATRAERLDSVALQALLPEGTKLITVRVALFDLWSAGLLGRERDGAYRYWRLT